MLQLGIIKENILRKNFSPRYEIKILNQQLNLTLQDRLLKELFEITKEYKEFKFQQNLQIEFSKNNEVFKNKIFVDRWFHSKK